MIYIKSMSSNAIEQGGTRPADSGYDTLSSFLEVAFDVRKTNPPMARFADIIGYEKEKRAVKSTADIFVLFALSDFSTNPKIKADAAAQIKELSLQRPHGLLFYGPEGTGKTTFSQATVSYVQSELDQRNSGVQVSYYRSSGTVKDKWLGSTDKNIENFFKAILSGPKGPKIVFLDEANQFFGKTSESDSVPYAEAFNKGLDKLFATEGVLVIMATNFRDLIPRTTRRAGRMDKSLKIGVPDDASKLKLMQSHVNAFPGHIPFDAGIDLTRYARSLKGGIATGADYREFFTQLKTELFQLKKEIEEGATPVIVTVEPKRKGKNGDAKNEQILQPLRLTHGSFPRTVDEARTYSLYFGSDGKNLKDYGIEVPYALGKDGKYHMTAVKIVKVTETVFSQVFDEYNKTHLVTAEDYASATQD